MRSANSRTHFLDANFVDAEQVAVSDARLRFQDVDSGRSVLDKEVVALVAGADESARIVDPLLLAVAVLPTGALVHFQAFAPGAAHHLHAPEARSHGVVLDDQPKVADIDGRRQVHHGDAGYFRNAEFDRSAFGALVFTEEVVGVVGVLQPDG